MLKSSTTMNEAARMSTRAARLYRGGAGAAAAFGGTAGGGAACVGAASGDVAGRGRSEVCSSVIVLFRVTALSDTYRFVFAVQWEPDE
jgi:hypothetical protein